MANIHQFLVCILGVGVDCVEFKNQPLPNMIFEIAWKISSIIKKKLEYQPVKKKEANLCFFTYYFFFLCFMLWTKLYFYLIFFNCCYDSF